MLEVVFQDSETPLTDNARKKIREGGPLLLLLMDDDQSQDGDGWMGKCPLLRFEDAGN